MKKKVLKICICPNSKLSGFTVFAHQLQRDGRILENLDHDEILDSDDIRTGIAINKKGGTAYPIANYVLSLLSDQDVDTKFYVDLLGNGLEYVPEKYKDLIKRNVNRFENISEPDDFGPWNREEMEYYDKNVATDELRQQFLIGIRNTPLWHIFIERERHLIQHIRLKGSTKNVLEIGCGNSRTISWLFPPIKYHYHYFGTDISLKRLFLAKQVIPGGDFIQCSAFNLPFKDQSFIACGPQGGLPRRPKKICRDQPLKLYFTNYPKYVRSGCMKALSRRWWSTELRARCVSIHPIGSIGTPSISGIKMLVVFEDGLPKILP